MTPSIAEAPAVEPLRPTVHPWVGRAAARLGEVRDTTPGRLRLARGLLVVLLLGTAALGADAARARGDIARDIQTRTEPVGTAAIEAYRYLAAADAAAVAEFLPGSPSSPEDLARYDDSITRAAAGLASAGIQSGGRGLDADRISDLVAALPVYTALVERARTAQRTGATGSAEMQQASGLLQSTLLRRAQALQRDQSSRLADQHRQAVAVPRPLLVSGGVSLVGLLVVQLLLFRRTRRVLNVGLVATTVAVLAAATWWIAAASASQDHLARSRRHSEAATEALGQAQIAARQARASEILALVADPAAAPAYDQEFAARADRLARNDGAGGALGAARRLASDPAARDLVETSVRQARVWMATHRLVQQRSTSGQRDEAVALAVGEGARTFDDLDATLSRAVAGERAALRREMDAARRALGGLAVGTGLLGLVAAAATARGIGTRLEEYR